MRISVQLQFNFSFVSDKKKTRLRTIGKKAFKLTHIIKKKNVCIRFTVHLVS